jgi:hypothetical protein
MLNLPNADAPDPSTLEHWWLEGDWKSLVQVDNQRGERFGDQFSALVFFAVAQLQAGKINKAKFLLQKAVKQGAPRDVARQALLAASMEKLSLAAQIQAGNWVAGTTQTDHSAPSGGAIPLRAKVLERLRSASYPAPTPSFIPPSPQGGGAAPKPIPMTLRTATQPTGTESTGHHGCIGILSGYYPGMRFNSPVNHRLYARQHGYRYIFDSTPRFDKRTYMRKLEAILEYLDLFDWLFWIDDDAYFTDFSVPLERFIDMAPGSDFIVCKSPWTKEIFTHISSGQFLLRNTPTARRFIEEALATDLKIVQKWWKSHLGMFTKGDQDALVYLLESRPTYTAPFCSILEHSHFNSRLFEFERQLDDHFLVHFTGQKKLLDKAQFCQRLRCNEYLCPPDLIDELALR